MLNVFCHMKTVNSYVKIVYTTITKKFEKVVKNIKI